VGNPTPKPDELNTRGTGTFLGNGVYLIEFGWTSRGTKRRNMTNMSSR
jgi:hypothetical protein